MISPAQMGLRQPWREGKVIRYFGYYFATLRTLANIRSCFPLVGGELCGLVALAEIGHLANKLCSPVQPQFRCHNQSAPHYRAIAALECPIHYHYGFSERVAVAWAFECLSVIYYLPANFLNAWRSTRRPVVWW